MVSVSTTFIVVESMGIGYCNVLNEGNKPATFRQPQWSYHMGTASSTWLLSSQLREPSLGGEFCDEEAVIRNARRPFPIREEEGRCDNCGQGAEEICVEGRARNAVSCVRGICWAE